MIVISTQVVKFPKIVSRRCGYTVMSGLLVDTISSNVAVFHLAGAMYHDGTPDALMQTAGERVLLLPLRQLLEWQSVMPSQSDIYVFENPQVFEEVIALLTQPRSVPTDTMTSFRKTYPCVVSSPRPYYTTTTP